MLEGLKSLFSSGKIKELQAKVQELEARPEPKAYYGTLVDSFVISYTGEKNLGEMGPVKNYVPDYWTLRTRSWQLYLESEAAQMIMKRMATWVVGNGLKLQSEPQREVLQAEGISFAPTEYESFNKAVESHFRVYANSTLADYSGMNTLNKIAHTAYINAIVGGDVLVVLRYVGGQVKVQLIDGVHVGTPVSADSGITFDGGFYRAANGNRIVDGIELDKETGQHIAYHVRKVQQPGDIYGKYQRIPARNKNGNEVAFLVYGLEYRLNNMRGLPLISAVMETMRKMEQYKEATLGTAIERQRLAYFIKHELNSSGEDPFVDRVVKASGIDAPGNLPTDQNGNQLANKIQVSTNRTTVNMTPGSEIMMPESKNELYFKDFYEVNIDVVAGTIGIPPNVATSKYNDSFSASRAAIKDWEHTLHVERKRFADMFYRKIYNFWLDVQALTRKINAPGYTEALIAGNEMALEAYRTARWVGATVPHIDPEKEVRAERLKLGKLGENLPLGNLEQSTEALNGGDSTNNLEQFARELEEAKKLKLPVSNTAAPAAPANDNPEEEEA